MSKVTFLLIRPIVVFSPFSFPLPLSITQFYILLEQTINITESFALALAKSIYYISVTSVKGTPIFRGKGHSFLVLTSFQGTLLY